MDATYVRTCDADKDRIAVLEQAVVYAVKELNSFLLLGRVINPARARTVVERVVRGLEAVAPDPDVVATGEGYCEQCGTGGNCAVCGRTS